MSDPPTAAGNLHAGGFNCAQSVFAAFAEQSGVTPEFALRLAAPFGGGMGRKGEACGALTGALMVLGLRYGNDQPEGKEEIYRITREFIAGFEQRHGTIVCRQLLGQDISTPEGLQAARDANLFSTTCPALVEATAKALHAFLLSRTHPAE